MTDIQPMQPQPLYERRASEGPMDAMLLAAVQAGNVEAIERMVALKVSLEEREAKREFMAALAKFQRECPPIPETSRVRYAPSVGVAVSYEYAKISTILAYIREPLAANGLSLAWESDAAAPPGQYRSVCTLFHEGGHSRQAHFMVPTESKAGMNPQQKVSSAATFADRQSLVRVLGIRAGGDAEDDLSHDRTPIDADTLEQISQLIVSSKADRPRFMAYVKSLCGVDSLETIPAIHAPALIAILQKKGQSQ